MRVSKFTIFIWELPASASRKSLNYDIDAERVVLLAQVEFVLFSLFERMEIGTRNKKQRRRGGRGEKGNTCQQPHPLSYFENRRSFPLSFPLLNFSALANIRAVNKRKKPHKTLKRLLHRLQKEYWLFPLLTLFYLFLFTRETFDFCKRSQQFLYMKNIGRARHARTFTIACLPPSLSSHFFFAPYKFFTRLRLFLY